MRTIKQFFIPGFLLLTSFSAFAQTPSSNRFTLEPVYGLETRLVRFPEPSKYVTSAAYGLRAIYGTTLLSGEAEYTTSHSRKDYPSQDQVVTDTINRFSLGARSTFPFGKSVAFYLRGGVAATNGKTEVKTSSTGISESSNNPLRIDPFGGTGLQFAFTQNMAINANVTIIRNAENKYDAQYSLGLSAKIGNFF